MGFILKESRRVAECSACGVDSQFLAASIDRKVPAYHERPHCCVLLSQPVGFVGEVCLIFPTIYEDKTGKPRGTPVRLVQGVTPASASTQTLQICHVESTHCNPVNSHLSISDLDLDILPGTSPSSQEYPTQCGKTAPVMPGILMMIAQGSDVENAIEPNLVVYRERCTQSMMCM